MRTSKIFPVISACIALAVLPPAAIAQAESAKDAPPDLEKLEEGEASASTVRSPEASTKITEKRHRGQVTSIKVESGDSTYYVTPQTPSGNIMHGGQRDTIRAPQWQILEFDWGREPKKSGEASARPGIIAPPPPAVPSKSQ